jgi:Caspase domain
MTTSKYLSFVCIVTAVFVTITGHPQNFLHSYAVVIGIDNYQNSSRWHQLNYGVKDAKAVSTLLQDQGYKVYELYDSQATKGAILSVLEDQLSPILETQDRIIVFFAGHGSTEILGGKEKGYVVPYDGDRTSSLISMADLEEQSENMGNAKHQLFIMDSCYGGLLTVSRGSIVDSKIPYYLPEITKRLAREVITAGGKDQEVLDNGPNGHSVFVDALLEAVRDGLADYNKDGYITFQELSGYITDRATNAYQTPSSGILPGHQGGEFIFVSPKGLQVAPAQSPLPLAPITRGGSQGINARGDAGTVADTQRGLTPLNGSTNQEEDPSAETQLKLAILALTKHDWDEALDKAMKSVTLEPANAAAHDVLGKAYEGKGQYSMARNAFRWASTLAPDNEEYSEDFRRLVRFGPSI